MCRRHGHGVGPADGRWHGRPAAVTICYNQVVDPGSAAWHNSFTVIDECHRLATGNGANFFNTLGDSIMAKRQSLKCDVIGNDLVWTERESNMEVFRFDLGSVAFGLEGRVREYGIRQIIADGAANATTLLERAQLMRERAEALMDGSWGTRATLPDGDIFRAMISVRGLTDSPELRAKWKSLDAKQRRAIGDRPDVRSRMETTPVADTDDLLDNLMT